MSNDATGPFGVAEFLSKITGQVGADELIQESLRTQQAITALRSSEALKAKIEVDELMFAALSSRASNFRNRTLDFVAPIMEDTVEKALEAASRWHRLSHDPITFRFTSPGGDPISGLVLFDALRAMSAEGTRIITVSLGQAASMAGVLLQAGDERIVGPNSWILIHELSIQGSGRMRVSESEEQNEFLTKLNSNLVDILSERSTLSTVEIKRRTKKGNWWLNADDAIRYGFADRKGIGIAKV